MCACPSIPSRIETVNTVRCLEFPPEKHEEDPAINLLRTSIAASIWTKIWPRPIDPGFVGQTHFQFQIEHPWRRWISVSHLGDVNKCHIFLLILGYENTNFRGGLREMVWGNISAVHVQFVIFLVGRYMFGNVWYLYVVLPFVFFSCELEMRIIIKTCGSICLPRVTQGPAPTWLLRCATTFSRMRRVPPSLKAFIYGRFSKRALWP